MSEDAGNTTSNQLTFWPEASPASRTASPGKEKAKPTSATSGLSLAESSESLIRLGYLLRTSLASELQSLTTFSLIWKRQATPHGRLWWVLGLSERRTEEIGSGLWPAVTASDGGQNATAPSSHLNEGRHGVNLAGAAMQEWKTPDVPNGGRSYKPGAISETGMTQDGKKRQVGLRNQVEMHDWRTPTAEEAGAKLNTLSTKEGEPARPGERAYRTTPKGERVLQSVTLNQQVEMVSSANWSTPTVQDGENDAGPSQFNRNTQPLNAPVHSAASARPTPRASENENRTTKPAPSHGNGHGKVLAGEVMRYAGQQDPASSNTNGKRPGSLNPAWVEQLMGYPDGWTELDD